MDSLAQKQKQSGKTGVVVSKNLVATNAVELGSPSSSYPSYSPNLRLTVPTQQPQPQELLVEIAARLNNLKQASPAVSTLVETADFLVLIECLTDLANLVAPLLPSVITTEASSIRNEKTMPTLQEPTRISKAFLQKIVSQPIEPAMFGAASRYSKPVSILDNATAVSLIELLGRYGPMTVFQLRAWLLMTKNWNIENDLVSHTNSRSLKGLAARLDGSNASYSQSLRVQIQYALQHLAATELPLVSNQGVQSWLNRDGKQKRVGHKTNQWLPRRIGLAFYELQTNSKSTLMKAGAAYAGQEKHTFGTQQTLAALNMVCATSNLLNLAAQAGFDTTTAQATTSLTASPTRLELRSHMDIMPWASSIKARGGKLKASGQMLRPDAIGRLVLENVALETEMGRNMLAQLATTSNIIPDLPELTVSSTTPTNSSNPTTMRERFQHEGFAIANSNRVEWPVALEYDRKTELAEVFAQKYVPYSTLYNQSFLSTQACPILWQEKFPVVLVVTEGNNKHLLDLMMAVKHQVEMNRQRHIMTAWWFTRLEWFKLAYRFYLSEVTLNRFEKALLDSDPSEKSGVLNEIFSAKAQKQSQELARIWIPLRIILPTDNEAATTATMIGSNPSEANAATNTNGRKAVAFNLGQLNRLSQYYIKLSRKPVANSISSSTSRRSNIAERGASQPFVAPKLFSQMCSIPLHHPITTASINYGKKGTESGGTTTFAKAEVLSKHI